MKRLLLSGIFALAASQVLFAQTGTFTWTGNEMFVGTTNNPPPNIDAQNFVIENGAVFGVDLSAFNLFYNVLFETSDTLNYTNKGVLIGIPGFDFENFPSSIGQAQPADYFVNEANGLDGGSIFCTNIFGGADEFSPTAGPDNPGTGPIFPLSGLATLKVRANNIIDTGLIAMDNTGLIDLRGQNLDLRHGTFSMSSGIGSAPFGILDWGSGGFGTNTLGWFPGLQLTPTTATSAIFVDNNFLEEEMVLNNSTPYFESLTGVSGGPNTIIWRGIFLQDNSPPNVTHNVYFDSAASILGSGAFHIEWVGTVPDPVTGFLFTNYFYLSDVPADRRLTNFSLVTPPIIPPNIGEFTLASSTIRQNLGTPTASGFVNQWPQSLTNNDFGFLSAFLSSVVVTNEVVGGSITNVPGRVQFTSSQSLNLANTRVTGPNYVLLSSPVNFEGNSGSVISTPFADLNLGVPGNSLTISNLLVPAVSTWTGITNAPNAVLPGFFQMGGLQAWSGSFLFPITNAAGTVITNDVRILLVNSALEPTGPALQQNVTLHTGHDLIISDPLNIYNNFSSDAQMLTVATNGPGAFSPIGQLNLLSGNIFWSTSLPDLQYLTNWGTISTLNQTFFAGNISSPYSDLNAATPYQTFINHGLVTNQGVFIRANEFQNSGIIAEGPSGSIDIAVSSSDTTFATNGLFLAPGGYVSISADELLASNGVMQAGGGPLTLNACNISDGYLFGNQFAHFTNSVLPNIVTNGNTWITTGGINVPEISLTPANLLGTTITNISLNNFVSPFVWPGRDLGCTQDGFGTNLSLGRLILNSDNTSRFLFQGPNANNALYVDSIEFLGGATNTDANGNYPGIVFQPGMKIYYAQALVNGISVAETLNGKNGGGFCWVSNYAGVYSSTNIPYPDGNTYIFNEALAISPDINSGGPDGSEVTNLFLVNKINKFPIPTNVTYDVTVFPLLPCAAGGGGAGGPAGTNSSGANTQVLANLAFPSEYPASVGQGSGSTPQVSFSVAAGSYNGLFYNPGAVTPSSSGYFSATLTPAGGFTAKLQIGSGSYSFSGAFDKSDDPVVKNVSGKKGLPTLTVELQLADNDHITGTVSGSDWAAQLQADRAAFSSKHGAPWNGKSTFLLASDTQNSTTNTGVGFGTDNISTGGGVQWSATLPDSVKIGQKTALSKNGVWPVYASLYGGSGVFIGWMQCTNLIHIKGSAVWEMPAGAGGLYSSGLTNQIDASGSRIQGSVGFFGAGSAVFSGAGLEMPLTNNVVSKNSAVQSQTNSLKLSVNPKTGLFTGSVMVPNSTQKLSFQGALLEKDGSGGGFFLNAGQSGEVYLGPAN